MSNPTASAISAEPDRIALTADTKGFVLKVVIALVAATMGPIAIPLMLGLLPWFRKVGPTAALTSTVGGLATWVFLYVEQQFLKDFTVSQALIVSTPLLVSLVLYLVIGFAKPEPTAERDALIDSLKADEPDVAAVKA